MTDRNDSLPADAPGDDQLHELLVAHRVPEPSADFVEDTLLRVRLHSEPAPAAPADFVDRIMRALTRDEVVGPRMERGDRGRGDRGPAPVPLTPPRDRPAERSRRAGEHWPKIAAAVIAAAAIVIALLPATPAPAIRAPQLSDLAEPARFPALGANVVTLSFSVARQTVTPGGKDIERTTPRAGGFYLPPPVSPAEEAGAVPGRKAAWKER